MPTQKERTIMKRAIKKIRESKPEPVIKVYPGLEKVAMQIADMTCYAIQRLAGSASNETADGKYKMQYKAQFILEKVIQYLQERV